MTSQTLSETKRRVSPALLALSGVSGVGISQNRLRIYIDDDSTSVRGRIAALLTQQAAGVAYEIVVSGKFSAR